MKLPGHIPLFTRSKREIPNEQAPDILPNAAERMTKAHKRQYPLAHLRRPPSGQYNCHGLTLANRRTGVYDPLIVEQVLRDDGYRKVREREVELGDVIVYDEGGEVTHSGLVVEVVKDTGFGPRFRILSKWGQAAEYLHMAEQGPYVAAVIAYWTDRP